MMLHGPVKDWETLHEALLAGRSELGKLADERYARLRALAAKRIAEATAGRKHTDMVSVYPSFTDFVSTAILAFIAASGLALNEKERK